MLRQRITTIHRFSEKAFNHRALRLALLLLFFWAAGAVPARAADDTIYGITNNSPFNIYTIDPVTGLAVSVGNLSFASAALARHPTTGLLYYTALNPVSGRYSVGTWDPVTSTNTTLSSTIGFYLPRLAFNATGTLYGMDSNNNLYTLSTATGAILTTTGPVTGGGLATGLGGDMAFAPDGTYYFTAGSNLYHVVTGTTSVLVGNTGVTAPAGLAFGDGGILYTSDTTAGSSRIYSLSTANGAATLVGSSGAALSDLGSLPKFANLSMTKAAAGTFVVNNNASYTLTVRNNGPHSASGPLTVSDTLPSGLAFASYTAPAGWTCSAAAAVVTCTNPGSLANAATAVITLTVAVTSPAAPNVTNTATVTSTTFDPTPASDSSTVTTPVMYITLVKSVNPPPPGPYAPGTDLTYTITFTNAGNVDANAFAVVDNIPAATYFKVGSQTSPGFPLGGLTGVALTYVGGVPTSGGGGAPAGYDARITRITWTFAGVLRPGNTGSVTFIARIR